MSASVLREAVARIRHDVDFGQAHGDDAFLLAVADWFDDALDAHLTVRPGNYLSFLHAVAAARAYLST